MKAAQLFDASGKLANDSTGGFLEKFASAFVAWIEANAYSNLGICYWPILI